MFIHLGLQRTGTTFLQKEVFPKFDIKYISNENLSGYAISSKQASIERYALFNYIVKKNDYVLVVFRKKGDWINSLYNKYIMQGGYWNYETWYERIFDTKTLDFDKYKKYISDNVDNFLFLDYEGLIINKYNFIKKICDFINIDMINFDNVYHNKSNNNISIILKKNINKVREII